MNPYLLKSIEFGPIVLRKVVASIPESRWDEAQPDRFTLREAVAHLADFEPIFRARMEWVLSEPGVTITPYDEEQLAIDHDYAAQDLQANLDKFAHERSLTATFLRGLTIEEFATPYVHPQLGPLVLEDQANMLLGHDLYHIEHAMTFK